MTKLIYGIDKEVGEFIANKMSQEGEIVFKSYSAIGVIDDHGILVGGIVFHNWLPSRGTIEFSAYCEDHKWLSRERMLLFGAYVFILSDCQMVYARTSSLNRRAVRILTTFGFTPHRIKRMRGLDEDEIIFTLTKDEWENSRFTRKFAKEA